MSDARTEPGRQITRQRVVVVLALVVGTVLLGFSLATAPGDSAFYPLALGVAAVWVIGGIAAGHVSVRGNLSHPFGTPFAVGVLAAGAFVVGGLVVREIDPVRHVVASVLDHARRGNLPLVVLVALVTGAAEEVFFRGALYDALGRRFAIAGSVLVYTLVTIATWNVMLVLAALGMGTVWALQRAASGGISAPLITHVVWSAGLLLALPPIIAT